MKAANNNNECPICNKAMVDKYKPFCSKRCADIDLGRWFKESYVIAGEKTSLGSSDEDEFDQ